MVLNQGDHNIGEDERGIVDTAVKIMPINDMVKMCDGLIDRAACIH